MGHLSISQDRGAGAKDSGLGKELEGRRFPVLRTFPRKWLRRRKGGQVCSSARSVAVLGCSSQIRGEFSATAEVQAFGMVAPAKTGHDGGGEGLHTSVFLQYVAIHVSEVQSGLESPPGASLLQVLSASRWYSDKLAFVNTMFSQGEKQIKGPQPVVLLKGI